MNKYQRQRSKEIKQMIRSDEFFSLTYPQARRYWNWLYRYIYIAFSPCDSCCSKCCRHKTKPPIVYCPNLVTVDMSLNRALKLLPQGIKMINN